MLEINFRKIIVLLSVFGLLMLSPFIPNAIAVDPGAYMNRVSVDSLDAQAGGPSINSDVTPDGRYVAFESLASNLVPEEINGYWDIFRKDVQTGEIVLVSADASGEGANSYCGRPSISSDGRYISFYSQADNLVPGDTNGYDIFRKDLQTGEIVIVSVDSAGSQANGESGFSSISFDGRYVAFDSWASNLVPEDTNGYNDIFRKDLQTGEIVIVSVDSLGLDANEDSYDPSISADGRYVAFDSYASDLVPGDTNGRCDIFRKDIQTGEIVQASDGLLGAQSNDLSSDGRYATFQYSTYILRKDFQTGALDTVSADSAGTPANDQSNFPSIRCDGRYVAFQSLASNLVPGDTNGFEDVFRKDLWTGEIVRVSVDSMGGESNGRNFYPSIGADGRYVSFDSNASDLIPGDTNADWDVFLANLGPPPDYKFDFDDDASIETMPGWTGFEISVYDPAIGYGYDNILDIDDINRGSGGLVQRDFHFSSQDRTFICDLASNTYDVTVYFGDAGWASDLVDITAEGAATAQWDDISTAVGEFKAETHKVTVLDGQLNLVFHDAGGTSSFWLIDGIEITADITPPTVASTVPSNLTSGVSLSTNVTATFSEDMDPLTVNASNFTLKDSLNNPITGVVAYNSSSKTATFDPDANLSYSTTYTATVSTGAEDIAGIGMVADKVWTFTSEADTTPPTAPSGLSATAISSSQINLSWSPSVDNVGVTGYKIERSPDNIAFSQIDTSTNTSYSNTGLNPSTIYYYRIRAYDQAGNNSDYSSSASATTQVSSTTTTRYEETSPGLSWTGTWTNFSYPSYSGGSTKYTNRAGASATFTFSGIQVSLIALKHPNRGIAKIYIDGTPIVNGDTALSGDTGSDKSGVDLYRLTAKYQSLAYTSPVLTSGSHTIAIEVTGLKNASATNCYVDVDAFDVVQ